MTKQFSFNRGQECWLLFRAAADPPAQVWMVCKKTERKIQVAPTERVQRDTVFGARLVPSRGTGKGKSSLNSFYELVSANGTAASWDNSRSDGRADTVLLCTPTEPGQGPLTEFAQVVAKTQPLYNRRYSRLPVRATTTAPIVNRLCRGLAVRLTATLSLALPPGTKKEPEGKPSGICLN